MYPIITVKLPYSWVLNRELLGALEEDGQIESSRFESGDLIIENIERFNGKW